MTVQRKRGQDCVLYLTIPTTDHRGNDVKSADMANPVPARAAFVSSTGDTVSMHIDPLPDGLDIWSRVGWNGGLYNVAAPPAYHSSMSRHTRHWSIDLKRTS
jgi:hypothetical protein